MRLLIAALLVALAVTPTLAQVPATVAWEVSGPEDAGLSAELERNGVAVPCGQWTEPTLTERRCVASVPVGTATFRLRMFNANGGAGPWSDPVTATVGSGALPGTVTIGFAFVPSLTSPGPPTMAVAHIASDSDFTGAVTDTFPTITVTPSGVDRLLVISLSWFDPSNTITGAARVNGSSSGVVADGSTYHFDGDRRHIAQFYVIAPAASALSIDGLLSASAENLFIGASAYSGAHQTTPLGTRQQADGGGTSISLALSGGDAAGMIYAAGLSYTSTMTSTAGTERWNESNGGDGKAFAFADATGASGTISWSQSSTAWGIVGNKILPSAAGAPRAMRHYRTRRAH